MIGTGNGGNVVGDINEFPGVDTPFGMMQLSPDTVGSGEGYSYGSSSIRGFSLDHASAGCSIFGDVPILPTTGPIGTDPGNASATFSHQHETATLGSYDVLLTDSDVNVNLAATTRTGLLSFTYPAGSTAQVLVKSGASLGRQQRRIRRRRQQRRGVRFGDGERAVRDGQVTPSTSTSSSRSRSRPRNLAGQDRHRRVAQRERPGSGAYLTFDTSKLGDGAREGRDVVCERRRGAPEHGCRDPRLESRSRCSSRPAPRGAGR